MRVDLVDMNRWPDRSGASVFYYSASIFDDAGTRYPARVLVEDLAVAMLGEGRTPGTYTHIVEAMCKRELLALVQQGKLAPENARKTFNIVFLTEDGQCEIRQATWSSPMPTRS